MNYQTTKRLVIGILLVQLAGVAGCQATRNMLAWGQSPTPPLPAQNPQLLAGSGDIHEEPRAITKEQKVSVQMAMARSLEKQHKSQEAISIYQQIANRDNNNAEANHRLAVLYDLQGKSEKAAEYYRQALKCDPKNAETYCDLGYSLYLQRRWAESEQNYRRAVELNPDLVRAHNNLGLLLARAGKQNDALWEFHRAGMDEPDARCNLALASMLENHWDEADQQCRAALSVGHGSQQTREKLDRFASIIAQAHPTKSSTALDVRPKDQSAPQQVSFNAPLTRSETFGLPPIEASNAAGPLVPQESTIFPMRQTTAGKARSVEGRSEDSAQSRQVAIFSPESPELSESIHRLPSDASLGTSPQMEAAAPIAHLPRPVPNGSAAPAMPTPAADVTRQASLTQTLTGDTNVPAQANASIEIVPTSEMPTVNLPTESQRGE